MTRNWFSPTADRTRRQPLRPVIAALCLAALPAVAAAQSSDDMDALVAAAKQEGSVMMYSGLTEADGLAVGKAFEAKYGIPVSIYRAPTNDVASRFDLELKAGRVNVDVLALADPFVSTDLQAQDALMEYTPPATQDGGYEKRFSNGFYNYVGLTIWPAAWNTEHVPADREPTDYTDFADPFWTGRLGMLDASTSLVGLQYYYLVRRAMGADFMKKLGAQKFQFVSPNNAIAERIVVGEIYGAPLLILNVANSMKKAGAPLKVGYMKSGTPVLARTVQAAAAAPHPNAAKLLVNYFLSQEGQQVLQSSALAVSPRTDVEVEAVPNLKDVNALTIDDVDAFVSMQDELRKEFEANFK